jgi:CHRD domain
MRSPLLVSAALVIVMIFATLTLAAPQATSYKLTSTLKASAEVPKPTGVRVGATGTFTGTALQAKANGRATLKWRLTFARLTGAAAAAHIHKGRPGTAGNVMVALCGPCRTGQRGTASITNTQLKAIRAGTTYVNVHTKTNAAGEIRGQVKAGKPTTVSGSPTPPPPAPPPPYDPPGDPYP